MVMLVSGLHSPAASTSLICSIKLKFQLFPLLLRFVSCLFVCLPIFNIIWCWQFMLLVFCLLWCGVDWLVGWLVGWLVCGLESSTLTVLGDQYHSPPVRSCCVASHKWEWWCTESAPQHRCPGKATRRQICLLIKENYILLSITNTS